jgi:AmmeMemoRadiSam system protein B
MTNSTQTDLRPSPIAGQWYEGNPQALAAEVDGFIEHARLPELEGEVLAVISPHAGHVYSGPVAGYAFAAIRHLQPDVVAVLSPLHQPYPGAVFTTTHAAYWTPLGEIPVAADLVERINGRLMEHTDESIRAIRHDREHSLEIELPFLQRIYSKPFRLVPIMVKDQDPEFTTILGEALFETLQGQNAVVVGSTDLSHFFPGRTADRLDERMLAAMQKLSVREMVGLDQREEGFACGLGAVSAVIQYSILAGARQGVLLKHANSGDITGDYSSVVGYGALAITR